MTMPYDLLDSMERTIKRYGLFQGQSLVPVALSGGKDSTVLMLGLRELGYSVVPVVIDMGYEELWADREVTNASRIGFVPEILSVNESGFKNQLAPDARDVLEARLSILRCLSDTPTPNATPCTQCYNSKIMAFSHFARRQGMSWVAFGHHGTDAVASFLKSALMYVDRWDEGHETFERENFEQTVDKLERSLSESPSGQLRVPLLERASHLLRVGLAGTDEPPVQPLEFGRTEVLIGRPLFEVLESDIHMVTRTNALRVEPSGCGHGATQETETPREMIHNRVLVKLSETSKGRDTLRSLLQLIVGEGLAQNGTVKVDVRRQRDHLLGTRYRDALGSGIKL